MSTNEKAPGGLLHRRPMSDPIFPKGSKTDGTIQSIPNPRQPPFLIFRNSQVHQSTEAGFYAC